MPVNGWGGIDSILIPEYHALELTAVSPDKRELIVKDPNGGLFVGRLPR